MPKDRAFSELSKKEKLTRAKAARRKARGKLKGVGKATSREERAKATRAAKAAERVISRLGGSPERADATVPAKKSKTKAKSAAGRKDDLMGGVKALFEMGRGVAKLPGREKKRLKKIEKGTR